METTYLRNLHSMQEAMTLRRLMEQEQRGADPTDALLLSVLDGYIRDIRYLLGIANPFLDDLHRLSLAKETIRAIDPVFDEMAQRADGESSRGAAFGLHQSLWQIASHFGWVIRAIEEQHPELDFWFAADREIYAEQRNGIEAAND